MSLQLYQQKLMECGEIAVYNQLDALGQENLSESTVDDDVKVLQEDVLKLKRQNKTTIKTLKTYKKQITALQFSQCTQDNTINTQSQMIESQGQTIALLQEEMRRERVKKHHIDLTRCFDLYVKANLTIKESVGLSLQKMDCDSVWAKSVENALGTNSSLLGRIHETIRKKRNRTLHCHLPDEMDVEEAINAIENDDEMKCFFERIQQNLYQ